MKIFASLLMFTTLFASINDPLRIEVFSGYRNDRIHWHLREPGEEGSLTYRELYRNIEYWENGLSFKVVHRDLSFFMKGSYGTFGKGTLTQRYANLPFTSEDLYFQFNTNGWVADVSGYMGYAVNLTADRTYKVILTPLIGYGGYFEQLERNHPTPTAIGNFSSTLDGKFHLVWNGVCFGCAFTIEPGNQTVLHAGYSYNLLHNQVKTSRQNRFNGVATSQTIDASSGGNPGQTGWAQIDWMVGPKWRIGVGGDIHYFSSRVVDATIEQPGVTNTSEKFKVRWIPISAWLQISRSL